MKRDYSNATEVTDVLYFSGKEVERTPAYGLKTLFVVGIQPTKDIIQTALQNKCKAVYFGANQSFNILDINPAEQWERWSDMIKAVLKDQSELFCTLDVDVSLVEGLLETGLSEHNRFIPMISVKMPYIAQLGYNAVLKVDDKDFNATNPGVWCHSIQNVTHPSVFTRWNEYNDDELIKGGNGILR